MSTIVVVKKNGQTVIAADTLTSSGSLKMAAPYKSESSKILKFEDNFLGFVGYAAHKNVFASIIEKHPGLLKFHSARHIFETCLKLHPILKNEYFLNDSEHERDPYESSQMDFLIANPHGIFAVSSYRDVFEHEQFWAMGSGREIALGAMYQAYDELPTAREIAVAGVIAACEFDEASGLPYTAHVLEMTQSKTSEYSEAALI